MIIPPSDKEGKIELDMEVLISEEDNSVYVKLSGFETIEDADSYGEYLQENLPFLLYQTSKIH